MGSGKTSWSIQYMNEASALEKFIYITPYLSEVERIRANTERTFFEPNNNNKDGSKMRSLKELIVDGKDIVSTHSLFQTADDELIELLTDSGYTLILDEVMDVIDKANVTQQDIRDLIALGHIEVRGNRVDWLYDGYDILAKYADIMRLAKAGNLFYHRGRFLIWAFPPRVFEALSNVYVMTYLFEGQLQRYYFDLFNFEYRYFAIKRMGDKYEITDYNPHNENRKALYELINLYTGNLNDIGELENAFSASYLRNMSAEKKNEVRKNIYNYFRNISKAKSKEILWTTIKDAKSGLSGKGYARSFLHCNARATNEYQDRWSLAYAFNRYMGPMERAFFEDHGVTVNQELLAVSDLLQWVYRSRIRNGQPIDLYLPSKRMRRVLKQWAENEI